MVCIQIVAWWKKESTDKLDCYYIICNLIEFDKGRNFTGGCKSMVQQKAIYNNI